MPPSRDEAERLAQLRAERAARDALRAAEMPTLEPVPQLAVAPANSSRMIGLLTLLVTQVFAVATVMYEGEHVSQVLVLYAAEFVVLDACALPFLSGTLARRLGGFARDLAFVALLLFGSLAFVSGAIDPRPDVLHGARILDLLCASNPHDLVIYVGLTLFGVVAAAWRSDDRAAAFCRQTVQHGAPRLIAMLVGVFLIGLAAGVGVDLFRAGLPWLSPHAFEVALAAAIAIVRVTVEHAFERNPPALRSA